MGVDPNLASLLRNLKVEDPWIPPKTWESIPTESGSNRSRDSAQSPQYSSRYLSTISESMLVRLGVNALQGVKSALVEIDHLSFELRSTPADRTSYQIPSLWCRSSSTSALGSMLDSISHSGLVFLALREFVNYYLRSNINEECGGSKNELKMHPPYSLVNQAFSVAVGKVLEGYILSLNTLLTAVKLRRSRRNGLNDGSGILTSVVSSDITLLEVYLHTEELRTCIEALGNICFPKVVDFRSFKEFLAADTSFEFGDFPRGADLLTYLYVLLRDADSGHRALLKYLFVQSFEPYCCFIKTWIYHARIDDPYGEFFVAYLDNSLTSTDADCSFNDYFGASIEERDGTSVPCFLKDVRRPLIRAGLQLAVLVKLLNLCNFVLVKEYEPFSLTNFNDILPFWVDTPNSSASLRDPLAFSKKGVQSLLHNRATIYGMVMEKLQMFFMKLDSGHQRIKSNVVPFGSLLGRREGVNSQFPLISDGELNNTTYTMEQEPIDVGAGTKDSDTTSYESSFEVDLSHFSDSSSNYSYEDEADIGTFSELPDMSHRPSQFLLSNLHSCVANKSLLQNSKTKNLYSSQHSFCDNYATMIPVIPLEHQNHESEKSCHISNAIKSDVTKCVKSSETWDEGYLSGRCWPLGALPKNPFYADMKCRVPKHLQITGFSQQKDDRSMETLKEEQRDTGELFAPFISEFVATVKVQSWNSYARHDLSINPMLTKPAWLRTPRSLRDSSFISSNGPYFPYFDFSSVGDPCKSYSESMVVGEDREQAETAEVMASTFTVAKMTESSGSCVRDNLVDQLVLPSVCSLREENFKSDVHQPNASGGAGWEGSLNYTGENAESGDTQCFDSIETFETPLDVIIDKCMLQEILVQYKYVSNFAIKLLEEGFNLREHLLALRRYHFMELADWANTFIMSLCNYKWFIIEPKQRITKIQGLLDLALQRSSCENDLYKESLFVYTEGQSSVPQSAYKDGLHAFDFIALGYRVDWPVNIIITQEALRIYAEIFRYLVQVRLAVISLTDIWHWLKGMYSTKQNQSMGSHKNDFTTLMKMRQQINHFVRTLQQYVHSQLSDVSWCKFQYSLKHQVRDMLDLESVHMTYLDDTLHICFLSTEMKAIETIIKNILQCALDFRLCFRGGNLVNVPTEGKAPLDLRSQIDFSQVFAIKSTFEKNIKDLYSLFLKSPRHGEFSLCRFWNCLNYNDYYSVTITNELHRYYH